MRRAGAVLGAILASIAALRVAQQKTAGGALLTIALILLGIVLVAASLVKVKIQVRVRRVPPAQALDPAGTAPALPERAPEAPPTSYRTIE